MCGGDVSTIPLYTNPHVHMHIYTSLAGDISFLRDGIMVARQFRFPSRIRDAGNPKTVSPIPSVQPRKKKHKKGGRGCYCTVCIKFCMTSLSSTLAPLPLHPQMPPSSPVPLPAEDLSKAHHRSSYTHPHTHTILQTPWANSQPGSAPTVYPYKPFQ